MLLRAHARQQLIRLGLLALFWVFLGALFASQLVFTGSFTWPIAFKLAFRDWAPWILWSPIVLWLAQKYPLESGAWRWSLFVHLSACVLVMVGCDFFSGLVDAFSGPPSGWGARPMDMRMPRGLERLPSDLPISIGDTLWGWPDEGEFGSAWPSAQIMGPPRFWGRGPIGRANFNVPIYCFVVSISHAWRFFQRSRERERKAAELEASLARAKLQALRMQLQPHFLFNTLHAISTLVHKNPAAADEMIGNLSELLRVAMDDSEQQEIPLAKEMDFLERYLEIQMVRFGDRLRVEKKIDPSLSAALVPPMILQPLVENAMKHGIEPHAIQGMVRIEARRKGEFIQLSVSDTGGGLRRPVVTTGRGGIGLANTQGRLEALYGGRFRFQLENGAQGGLIVWMEIPYRVQAASPPIEPAEV